MEPPLSGLYVDGMHIYYFLYNILCYRRYFCLFTRPPETSFIQPGYVRASHATEQNWRIAYQPNDLINIRYVLDIMENLFFLVVAAILLAISVYFLISYLKDRKKTKLTFNKRKW